MSRSEEFEEIRIIADAICDDEVSDEQMVKLENLLERSEEAKKFYLDYVKMHGRLQAESNPQFEIVMRRLQIDEVIVRPAGSGGSGQPPKNTYITDEESKEISGTVRKKISVVFYIIGSACLLALLIFTYFFGIDKGNSLASLENGSLVHEELGILRKESLKVGLYTVKEDAEIHFETGDVFIISAGSEIELKTKSGIHLISGSLERDITADPNFRVSTEVFEIKSPKSGFSVKVNNEGMVVKTKSGNAVLSPKRWQPRHYWNFDGKGDRALDLAGTSHGVFGEGTKRTEGLIGSGSFKFSNQAKDFIDVGSGGGTALATGSFSVTDGVSIEALVKTEWSAEKDNYDEIFRKDQDKNLRMLLSFQNDLPRQIKTTVPKVDSGPTLSFGLYLVGQGYHELEMPLDGKEGRPSLEELKSLEKAHIVATYNVSSGLKALFINGVRVASHKYPPGTKMLSGGPGKATIGNSPFKHEEPFTGLIDEVAFYDFALSKFMIDYHFELIQEDKSYFGLSNLEKLSDTIEIILPKSREIKIDSLSGLPE